MTRARDTANIDGILTTTGDMFVASAAATPARLGIGSTGQVLTVAGGVPTWASASAAATSYTLLNSGGTALTGATSITVSSISGYNKLYVTIEAASTVNAGNDFYITFNGDSATNYRDQYQFVSAYPTYDTGNQGANQRTTGIFFGQMANTAASGVRGSISIDGANSSGVKVFTHWSGANNSPNQYNVIGGGVYTGTSVISSFTIASGAASNFDAGTLYIYGAN